MLFLFIFYWSEYYPQCDNIGYCCIIYVCGFSLSNSCIIDTKHIQMTVSTVELAAFVSL